MPFNYYEIVTVLTIIVMGLAALFFITRNAQALWILAVATIPFSSEIVVEVPIDALTLPVLFFPTDFLAGVLTAFIFLFIIFPDLKSQFYKNITKSGLFWLILLYFGWMLVASVLSIHVVVSIKFFILQVSYFIAYGLLGAYLIYSSPDKIRSAYSSYMVPALILTFFVCIVEHLLLGGNRNSVDEAIMPFFREHTVYGAFTAWMVMAYFVVWMRQRLSLILMGVLILSGVTLFLSYSRGGWLSVMGAFVVLPVLRWMWGLERRKLISVLGLALVLAVGGGWFLLIKRQMWLEEQLSELLGDTGKRIASSFDTERDVSNIGRIHRWIVAWNLFKDYPITGIGPNSFAEEYHGHKFSSDLLQVVRSSDLKYAGIHSEYITSLAEMGILGFLLLVAIYGLTLYYPFQYAFSARDRAAEALGLLIALPLLSYYLHAFINNFMDHGKIAALIYMHWGAAIALEIRMRREKELLREHHKYFYP